MRYSVTGTPSEPAADLVDASMIEHAVDSFERVCRNAETARLRHYEKYFSSLHDIDIYIYIYMTVRENNLLKRNSVLLEKILLA